MAEFRANAPTMSGRPLNALIITDGKMGDLAQCRGVADALGATVHEIVVKPSKIAEIGRAHV